MDIFKYVHDRNHTRSVKWDLRKTIFGTNDVIPMWVADMDFPAPAEVNEAIMRRAKHGIYGYTTINQDVKQSIVDWQFKRHNWQIKPSWLSFSPGVVTGLHIAIQALTNPGDEILIQTPVYTPFYDVIETHNREIIKNPLVLENDHYTIDFNDLEAKLKTGVKAFILCSPHNPVGRVWTKSELEKIAHLCLKYNVLILADEVHADLVFPEHEHTPMAAMCKDTSAQIVTFNAPSKTFNLAGLQASYIITENEELRTKINQQLNKQGISTLNTVGNIALEAAYTYGEQWLNDLLHVLHDNKKYVVDRLKRETTLLDVIDSEGTYLLWLNCQKFDMNPEVLQKFFVQQAKVGLNPGSSYGREGNTFMRMNIACPRPTLEEGVNRIIQAVNDYF